MSRVFTASDVDTESLANDLESLAEAIRGGEVPVDSVRTETHVVASEEILEGIEVRFYPRQKNPIVNIDYREMKNE